LFTATVLYVGWFSSLQNTRLLAPAVALLAPAAADLLVPIVARRRALTLAGGLALALSFGIVAAVGVVRAARYWRDPMSYLQRETQRYDDIDWMNRNLDPARDRVASNVKVIGYLTIPSLILDPTRQLEIAGEEFDPPHRLLGALRRQHVTHVFGAAGDFDALATDVRLVHANDRSRLGGVRFFREPPTEATAVYEILDPSPRSR